MLQSCFTNYLGVLEKVFPPSENTNIPLTGTTVFQNMFEPIIDGE